MPAFFADGGRWPVTGRDHGGVVEREELEPHALDDVAIGGRWAGYAADAPREERVSGEEGRPEQKARAAVGVAGRMDHADRRVRAKRKFVAVDDRRGARGKVADRL